jgi:crotonobetainyl-CoA:carnitine CoA-transferase CaiB-like acyl-CoA transferase
MRVFDLRDRIAQRKLGLVYVSLSAYGAQGPWCARRGFDSLA